MPAKSRGVTKAERNRRAREAARVVRTANANPDTRCCECGNTLDRCGPNNNGRGANGAPVQWDAGHPDGRWSTNELRPECSWCNRSRGAEHGNRLREPNSGLAPWQ